MKEPIITLIIGTYILLITAVCTHNIRTVKFIENGYTRCVLPGTESVEWCKPYHKGDELTGTGKSIQRELRAGGTGYENKNHQTGESQ